MAGSDELEIELPAGSTARELVSRLRDQCGMDRLPEEPALAVNQVYAPLTESLSDGDEVALLPPVAGG